MKIAIIYARDKALAKKWSLACEKKSIEYQTFDLANHDWLNQILNYAPDFSLLRPPGDIELYKTMFDERILILRQYHGMKVFPTFNELLIYENKRYLSYFLDSRSIPHPFTKVFYNLEEATEYLNKKEVPIVFKSSIGASGSGVIICKSKTEANNYLTRAFSHKGIPLRSGPNRVNGNIWKWLKKAINNPRYAKERISHYKELSSGRAKNMAIIQQYIPHDFEWRIAKIGSSFFGHQKTKHEDKCSGTRGIDYIAPPFDLLDFVKRLCEENSLHSVAIDIFEHNGKYLVNEIQCIFGHVQTHILEVDGKPGRYLYQDNKWVFEEGMFNSNESYDLRLETALELFEQGKL